jgi:hypothetical protein
MENKEISQSVSTVATLPFGFAQGASWLSVVEASDCTASTAMSSRMENKEISRKVSTVATLPFGFAQGASWLSEVEASR